MLLERQVAVNGDEDVELAFGKGQQSPVLNGGPSHLRDGLHDVPLEFPGQTTVDALVEEQIQVSVRWRRAGCP